MFPMVVVMTRGSLCGWCTHRPSASVKVMSSISLLMLLGGLFARWCRLVKGGVLTSYAYLSCTFRELLLCVVLHRPYVYRLIPQEEMVALRVVTGTVNELDSLEEHKRSCELPLGNKILYLIFNFMTIVKVMSHVTMIATIFVLIPLCSLILYGEGPYEVDMPFISLKYLSSINV